MYVSIRRGKYRPGTPGSALVCLFLVLLCVGGGAIGAGQGRVTLTAEERTWLEAHPNIRVGFDPAYAPYTFRDDHGRYQGVAPDYLAVLGELLGVSFEPVPGLSWPQILQGARERTLDLVATAVRTPERDAFLNFSGIYIPTPLVIMTRSDESEIRTPADLDGRAVALVTGYSSAGRVLAERPGVVPSLVETPLDGLRAVAAGEADAYVGVLGVNTYLATRHGISNLKVAGPFEMVANGQRLGVRKDWPELVSILDKAMDAIPEAERIALLGKWVPVASAEVDALVLPLTASEREWIREHPVLRVGVASDNEPFDFIDEQGRHSGIASDYLELLRKRTGLKLEIHRSTSGSTLQEALSGGEIDVVAAASPTTATAGAMDFSSPYISSPLMIFARKDGVFLAGIEDLFGRTVAVKRGSLGQDVTARHPRLRRLELDTAADGLRAVSDGIADAQVDNLVRGSYVIEKHGLANLEPVASASPTPQTIHLAVSRDWPILLGILDKGLASVPPDEAAAIRRRWIGVRFEQGIDLGRVLRWAIPAGVLVIAGFLVFAGWNRRLSAEIRRRRSVEDELVRARTEAEQANRYKTRFLANMSHEIRTPMNAIIGTCYLAARTDLSGRQRDYLGRIQSASHHLLGIINDILDISRIEAGRLDLEHTEFDLDEVLSELAGLVALRAEEKGIELLFDVAADTPRRLMGDPLRLGQVLTNLANNAVKFTAEGQILVRVRPVEAIDGGVRILFEVQDSGIGISPDQLRRVFEPFTQADGSTTRRYGGSGLGLSIARHLVERMGGHLDADSTPGTGSRFHFAIPFDLPETPTRSLAEMESFRGFRALVVDDRASARELLAGMLASFGFRVERADSGEEALERVGSGPPPFDLILMDWKMPGLDGIDTSAEIRRRSQDGTAPKVILVTAYSREDLTSLAQGVGMDGFLIKPITPSLLYNVIRETLSRSPRQRAPADAGDGSAPRLAPSRVLLAEDNPINQEMARELLESVGLRVELAGDGRSALERVLGGGFDLVLMDLQMPEMDGFEATRRIRVHPEHGRIPIVAMTAHALAGDRERCLAAGMDDYVSKPIDPRRLFRTLERWLPLSPGPVPADLDHRGLPPSAPCLDIDRALARTAGRGGLLMRLLADFRRDHRNDAAKLRAALERGDGPTARRVAHTLAGTAGNLGAAGVESVAREIQATLERGREPPADAVATLGQALAEVIDHLDRHGIEAPAPADEPAADLETALPRLLGWLDEGDVRALKAWRSVAAALVSGGFTREAQEIGRQVEEYDMEGAAQALRELTKRAGPNASMPDVPTPSPSGATSDPSP